MKRIALTIVVTAIFALIFSVSSLFADESIIKLADFSGKVFVKISPAAEWTDAKKGQGLNQSDSVKTGDNTSAVLEFSNGSSVALKSNTEIIVEELVWDNVSKKVGINMTSGALRTIIKKMDAPSEFKIRTPTAISGARGTIFYVVVFPSGTGVYVQEGLIDFLNTISGETYTVYQGNGSNANSDGTTIVPHELSKEEVDSYLAGYDMSLVAEPYSEPGGGGAANEVTAPEVTQENSASRT